MSGEIPETIWIVTDEPSGAKSVSVVEYQGGLLRNRNEQTENILRDYGVSRVPVERLKTEMSGFLKAVEYLFDEASPESKLQLDELTLSVEINGEGQIKLLGIGGKAGSKGAVQLTFRRKDG